MDKNDKIDIGPGIFASGDKLVLNWEGVNYVPQAENWSETADAAALRYARQLVDLKEGLLALGYNLESVSEDELVDFTLGELRYDYKQRESELVRLAHELQDRSIITSPGGAVNTVLHSLDYWKDRAQQYERSQAANRKRDV